MTSTLFIVQIVLAILITLAVLLQKSSSIGLGAYSGSNESLFGAKGPAGFLTKITFILGLLFIINTLALGYLYSKDSKSSAVDTVKSINKVIPAANVDANASTKESNSTKVDTTKAAVTADANATANADANKAAEANATTKAAEANTTKDNSNANATKADDTNATSSADANKAASSTDSNATSATTDANASSTSADTNSSSTAEANTTTTGSNAATKAEQNATQAEAANTDKPVVIEEKKEEEAIIADINAEKASTTAHILKGVYFKTASSQLADKSQRQLNVVAAALKEHSNVKIKLRGHTDNTGSKDVNLKLSSSRAKAVKDYLVNKGIDANRIQIEGKASTDPITSNKTKEGRLNNRRVDIAVVN